MCSVYWGASQVKVVPDFFVILRKHMRLVSCPRSGYRRKIALYREVCRVVRSSP